MIARAVVAALALLAALAISCASRPAGMVRLATGELDSVLLDPMQDAARQTAARALECDAELVILGGAAPTFVAEGCEGTITVECARLECSTTPGDPLGGSADEAAVAPLVRARATGIAACTGGIGIPIVIVWSQAGELDVAFPTEPSDPLVRDCVRAQIRPYRAPDVRGAGSVSLSTDEL